MIIHHQDGSKAIIETLVFAKRTKHSVVLCYRSAQTAGKGIIVLNGQELLAILAAARSDEVIDDVELFKKFANISPIIKP